MHKTKADKEKIIGNPDVCLNCNKSECKRLVRETAEIIMLKALAVFLSMFAVAVIIGIISGKHD